MSRKPHTGFRAFTQIELLVVVTIISLLVAMLLPATAKSRQTMLRVFCSNNMKQLGIAVYSYATDNKTIVPPNAFSFGGATAIAFQTVTRIDYTGNTTNDLGAFATKIGGVTDLYNFGYVTSPALFYCPADGDPYRKYAIDKTVWLGNTRTSPNAGYLGYIYTAGYRVLTPTYPYVNMDESNQNNYRNGGGYYLPWLMRSFEETRPQYTGAAVITPRKYAVMARDYGDDTSTNGVPGSYRWVSHTQYANTVDGINVLIDDGHVDWKPMGSVQWVGQYSSFFGTGTTNVFDQNVYVSDTGTLRGFRN